ncbi:LamG domain-containing protein [Taibaiella chishuiensis]|nr:LamG domain-containing protein [Taibaiella chishuiensis]
MKKKLPFLAAALALLSLNACNKSKSRTTVPCIPASLQSSVLAFYPFDKGSLNDFSGNGHHLTNTSYNGPIADRNGNPNCAFNFADSLENFNQYVGLTDATFLDGLTQFSISLWYKPFDSISRLPLETLVCRTQAPNSYAPMQYSWAVALFDCRKAVFEYTTSVWDQNILPIGTTASCMDEVKVRTGSWHHLAATYDYAAKQIKIYRDGVLQNTETIPVNNATVQDLGYLLLGRRYQGKMDDVVLLSKTLSQAEVIALRDMEPCCLTE